MDSGLPLFDYPQTAGSKENTTSRDAAEAIEKHGRAARLRDDVKRLFAEGFTGTADECAAALGESPLSIRPRVSEIHAKGLIEPTGERRASLAGGRPSHVWRRVN